MLPKPAICRDCPLYGDGMGFVPDQIVPDSELVVLAQNPGEDEEAGRQIVGWEQVGHRTHAIYKPCPPLPLIGQTGWETMTKYLPLTGFTREEVSFCNVLKCRWKHTNEMPTGVTLKQAVDHCTTFHLKLPPKAKVVLAMGAHAWALLGGPPPITSWRGYTKPGGDELLEPTLTS